ncbi:MAG: cell wall hydrolase [Pseudomonadota bacterium]|nr:cell wall hydrolase [Pseudomonadota bacterium]
MSFSQRVAAIAAITLSLTGLVGASAPGFAAQLHQSLNAALPVSVPQTALPDSPGLHPAIATSIASDPLPAAQPADPADSFDDGDGDYASLTDAVAAQKSDGSIDEETRCLAGAIYFESKGEPLSGQLAVADVVLNRAKSGRFPDTACSVVTQPGQFSFVRGGRMPAIPSNSQYRTAVAVAKVAMADAWDSPAEDAMYFHARRVAPAWHRVKVAAIGNHLFYR